MTVLCQQEYSSLVRIIKFAAKHWSAETDVQFVELCDRALGGDLSALDDLIAFGDPVVIAKAEEVADIVSKTDEVSSNKVEIQ